MKNLFFLLALCAGLVFVSCGSDDDNSPVEDFITAKIDGADFEAVTITAIADNSLGEELVLISGVNSDGSFTIGLNIPTSTPTGTVTIDATDFAITFTDAAENAFFTTGTLTIDTNDTEGDVLEGSFSFTATDDTDPTNVNEITEGEFRITY